MQAVGPTAPPKKIFALNFFAAIAIAEGLRPLLKKKGGNCVVTSSNSITNATVKRDWVDKLSNVADENATMEFAGHIPPDKTPSCYSSSKHALARWVRRVSSSWAADGLRINAVAPGNTTTCLQEIWTEFPAYTQYQVRSALAKCGLTTEHIESQVRVLSGGEQAKVRLCKLINRESNVLLLDEPTNHLDVDAKDELKRALKEYRGSILLICHEPEFYEGLATDVWDCKEWALKLS